MLPLAEFQRRMVSDILGNMPGASTEVHRDTVFGALLHALRLTFPTVVRLMGEGSFEKLAMQYARDKPPDSAVLYVYGSDFPNYLRRHAGAPERSSLFDVARFDLSIDRAAHHDPDRYRAAVAIDSHLEMQLQSSLSCLRTDYPVDLIRDALEAGSPDLVAGIDMTSRARYFAIWRGADGARVKSLSPTAAAFLNALLEGGNAEIALLRASEQSEPTQAIAAIQTELLAASFTRLTRLPVAGTS